MNFLAHAYLSGEDPELLFGNMIADHIKGKVLESYPVGIVKGVLLHRAIDSFTDDHPVVKVASSNLSNYFGKYSGVVLDIYFDHFLAVGWSHYNNTELHVFARRVYYELLRRYLLLPARSRRIIPWMVAQNWLSGYANLRDLERVFNGMTRRASFKSGMENAIPVLSENYQLIHQQFQTFFPQLEAYATKFRLELENNTETKPLV